MEGRNFNYSTTATGYLYSTSRRNSEERPTEFVGKIRTKRARLRANKKFTAPRRKPLIDAPVNVGIGAVNTLAMLNARQELERLSACLVIHIPGVTSLPTVAPQANTYDMSYWPSFVPTPIPPVGGLTQQQLHAAVAAKALYIAQSSVLLPQQYALNYSALINTATAEQNTAQWLYPSPPTSLAAQYNSGPSFM